MTYATKMQNWGDECVGFEQQRQINDMIVSSTSVRFFPRADHVEIAFNSTVHYGGGVQHVAEGSLVLTAADAADLGAEIQLNLGADPHDQIIELVKAMPDPETSAAIPWMRSLRRLAKGIE